MPFAAPSHLGEHVAHPAAFCWKGVSSLRLCGALWGSVGLCGVPRGSFPSEAAVQLQTAPARGRHVGHARVE